MDALTFSIFESLFEALIIIICSFEFIGLLEVYNVIKKPINTISIM